MVKLDASTKDRELIRKIVQRANAEAPEKLDALCLSMDITATHANGCPLRLQDLLDADAFNFFHDLYGISKHLDRDTGKLGDMFRPRFAVKVPVLTETV